MSGSIFDVLGRVANAVVNGMAAAKPVEQGCGKCSEDTGRSTREGHKPTIRTRRAYSSGRQVQWRP